MGPVARVLGAHFSNRNKKTYREPMKLSGSTVRIALSTVMLVLAFPGFGFHFLSWIALIPLFFVIAETAGVRAFLYSFATGCLFHIGLMWWVLGVEGSTSVNFSVMNFYCALYFGLFGVLASRFHREIPEWDAVTFPLLWVALEYLRANTGFLSYPQGILGYSQYTFLPASGVASFGGVYGVSFLIVAVNAALFSISHTCLFPSEEKCDPGSFGKWSLNPALGVLGIVALILGASAAKGIASGSPEEAGDRIKIALVQPNGRTWEKDFEEKYLRESYPLNENLTMLAAEAGPSLIIWPSTSVAGVLPVNRKMVEILAGLARKTGSHLLVGAHGFDKFSVVQRKTGQVANSAFLFSPSGVIVGRYDKIRLFPFTEYLPLRDSIKPPHWMFPRKINEKLAGTQMKIFNTGHARFGVQICWENMFPGMHRKMAANGADFIVGQTDEAFTRSPGAHYQMLAYYVFRAIENGIPVVKSSNDGVSCLIDPGGRIITSVRDGKGKEVDVSGFAIVSIPLGAKRSVYNRVGDAFAFMTIFGSVAFFLATLKPGILRKSIRGNGSKIIPREGRVK